MNGNLIAGELSDKCADRIRRGNEERAERQFAGRCKCYHEYLLSSEPHQLTSDSPILCTCPSNNAFCNASRGPAVLSFDAPSKYSHSLLPSAAFSPIKSKNAGCTRSVKSEACRLRPFSLNANREHSLVIAEPPYAHSASSSSALRSPS